MIRSRPWVATATVGALIIAVLGLLIVAWTARRHGASSRATGGAAWLASLNGVEEALANQDTVEARRALERARRAAHVSADWRAMLLVGTTSIRIAALEGHDLARWQARTDYLGALLAAYREKSLDGVLESGEAFATLGDRGVVEHAMRMAEELAGKNVEARGRVRAFHERFARAGP